MMHTLIAGVSGSGKSYTEHELIKKLKGRMILIDPKRVELRQYKDDPRCAYYANNLDASMDALHEAEEIMDGRYRDMEKEGQTLYDGRPLYIIIDEAAALMNADKRTRNECEKTLYNLTFLGRAADPAGRADWVRQLDAGADRHAVMAGFYNSAEFNAIMASYGL